MTEHTDFDVQNHGSIILLYPDTEAARQWVASFLPEEALTFGDAVVIEPRYFEDIRQGIIADGLSIS
jgi:hypothetical protein